VHYGTLRLSPFANDGVDPGQTDEPGKGKLPHSEKSGRNTARKGIDEGVTLHSLAVPKRRGGRKGLKWRREGTSDPSTEKGEKKGTGQLLKHYLHAEWTQYNARSRMLKKGRKIERGKKELLAR